MTALKKMPLHEKIEALIFRMSDIILGKEFLRAFHRSLRKREQEEKKKKERAEIEMLEQLKEKWVEAKKKLIGRFNTSASKNGNLKYRSRTPT